MRDIMTIVPLMLVLCCAPAAHSYALGFRPVAGPLGVHCTLGGPGKCAGLPGALHFRSLPAARPAGCFTGAYGVEGRGCALLPLPGRAGLTQCAAGASSVEQEDLPERIYGGGGGLSIAKAKDLVVQVASLAEPFWEGEGRGKAIIWTLSTAFLALFSTMYAVSQSFVQRFFWNALSSRDVAKFNKFLLVYIALLSLGPPILVMFDWAKSRMALHWREALTRRYLGRYMDGMKYYKLQIASDIDNADQRIAEDIRGVTEKAVSLFCTVAVSLCDLFVFSAILYKIYPPLLALLLVYSLGGTAITLYFGQPLISLNRAQLRKEADLRYNLVRVRENGEAIAFYNGDAHERREAERRFGDIAGNAKRLFNFERGLGFFTKTYRYLAQVVPAVVIGPRFLAGKAEMGQVSQTFFSFVHVLNDLSIVVNEFSGPGGISAFSAGVGRLRELERCMEQAEQRSSLIVDNKVVHQSAAAGSGGLRCVSLHVTTPTEPPRKLVRDLNLEVAEGERVLVVGQSGVGKTSLLRAVAGLWDTGGGMVETPPKGDCLFLSQKPYMTLGTLRENVAYPRDPDSEGMDDDTAVLDALKRVNMESAAERVGGLDTPAELATMFSLGEQQRLQFARVLLNKPKLAILDESTSALDLENEEMMYELLRGLGTTTVSVGNRPSLVAFHDRLLRIEGGGEWSIEELSGEEAPCTDSMSAEASPDYSD